MNRIPHNLGPAKEKLDAFYDRMVKSQMAPIDINVRIRLDNFTGFPHIIECIKNRTPFGIKYSDGLGIAVFVPETLTISDFRHGKLCELTASTAKMFINVIKLYLINHREVLTEDDCLTYVRQRKLLLN